MRYRNLDPIHRPPGLGAVLKWSALDRLTGRRRPAAPGEPAPAVNPDAQLIHEHSDSTRLTWIGHASFLLQLAGRNLLIDPVFSERIGWVYPRHGAPGLTPEQLPDIHAILITHSHFDHMDRASIEALPRSATVACGRRLGPWFVKRGFARVIELDWWESVRLGNVERNSFRSSSAFSVNSARELLATPNERNEFRSTTPVTITFVPARHWSKRTPFDTNRTLWGGFVVSAGGASIYHAGDTAWFDGFAEIGRRFPYLDAALLPIGGYTPAWFMDRNHINPEQAGQAFLACGARSLVPGHWGTFQMTDEPLREPIARLRRWWAEEVPDDDRRLLELAVGETAVISQSATDSAAKVLERGLA